LRTASIYAGPEFLAGAARQLWNELAPALAQAGLLGGLGSYRLAAVCESFKTWRRYEDLSEHVGAEMAVRLGYRRAADRARGHFMRELGRY
jgi:phage terminase small subunit